MTTRHHASKLPADDEQLTPVLARDGLTVRLVGCGGTGSIVGRYLSVYLGSLQCETCLVFMDGDQFEPKNAARMLFGSCGNKANVVRRELLQHFVDSRLALLGIEQHINRDTISQLLPGGVNEVIILCVDNHATRKLVSDYCEGRDGWSGLDNICLISGGNDGVGADSNGHHRRGSYGNCQIHVRRNRKDITPALTKYHDEIENPADRLPGDEGCTDMLSSVPQLLFANLMSASAICNTFWLYLCDRLHYREVTFDIVDARMRPLGIPDGEASKRPSTRRNPGS